MPDLIVWEPTEKFITFVEKANYHTMKRYETRCKVVKGYTEDYEILTQLVVYGYTLGSFNGLIGLNAIFDGEPFEYMEANND